MSLKSAGMAVAGAVAATALAVGPAFATDTTYDLGSGPHAAKGGLIWLNRSVTVQGSVTDIGGAGTQIKFESFAVDNIADVQTRTAVNEVRSYNFTLDGSEFPGGITVIRICVIDLHDGLEVECVNRFRP